MRIPRLHVPGAYTSGQRLQLPATTSHHLLRVLRLRVGAQLRLFNGEGAEYSALLDEVVAREHAWVVIETALATMSESPLQIHILQGISRGERMDYTVQKCAELGAYAITPVVSAHCEVRLSEAQTQKRLAHWRGIALSACEQSGRTRIPIIAAPMAWDDTLLRRHDHSLRLILDPDASSGLMTLTAPDNLCVSALIGPEGGFAAAEVAQAQAAGYLSLRLGPRILRTETAAPTLLAVLQARWGDLG